MCAVFNTVSGAGQVTKVRFRLAGSLSRRNLRLSVSPPNQTSQR